MLKQIYIQNYAIIESATIPFSKGLNIITGETGAGKSILLGALGLIMGRRADTKVLFNEEKKCIVEAKFGNSGSKVESFLQDNDLDIENELVIRREIAHNGKSRAFVNDTPVTLDILHGLSALLLDIQQQFDMLDIQDTDFQTEILDALAGQFEMVAAYKGEYKAYIEACKELEKMQSDKAIAAQERDFLQFQNDEIQALSLQMNEFDQLEHQIAKMSAAEDIKTICRLAEVSLLEGDGAMVDTLSHLAQQFHSIKNIDTTFEDIKNRLLHTREELADIAREASKVLDDVEFDPSSYQELQLRYDMIVKLCKKHQVSTGDELLTLHQNILQKLNSFEDIEEAIQQKQTDISQLYDRLMKKADVISQGRHKAKKRLEIDIPHALAPLSMEYAQLHVDIVSDDKLYKDGKDSIKFLFATNKGAKLLPIKDVASGGEVSRLTLCIKSMVAEVMTLPTLVFDEIDTGVSGEVAHRMGMILIELGRHHQVISITHSPQVASKADTHLFVHKTHSTNATTTSIKILNHEDRIYELAKMLSGDPPSVAALANAQDMMRQAH